MTEKRKSPALRFRGYTDDWEQRKFDKVFDCTIPNNTLSRAELSYDEGTVLNVHYGDVLVKYGSVLDVQRDEIPHIPQSCREDFRGALLQEGDVIIADTAEDETTGKACEIGNLQGSSIVSGLHTMVCRPRQQMALGYLGYYLNSNAYHHQLLPLMQGIKVLSLSRSNIQKTSVSYPTSVEEQQLIASYFNRLDNLITLHQRKLEKLKLVKKSMLEKMFPKNGSSVPEIRFNGFTDDWEQRKFSELYARSSEKNDGSIGMDKNITVATMQFKNDVKVSTTEYLKTYYTYKLGDIAFEGHQSKEFRYGRFVENDIGNGIVSHIFAVFRPIQEYDLCFWKYAINNETLMQRILARSTKASTMMHDLVTNDFLKETFLVPSVKEQKQIGAFLNKLDNLITLHQRKVEKLQIMKKSMLEKMFV